jgi:hypothetical protein
LNILDIPGVGPKMKERLIQHFGSEDSALQAVMNGEMFSLTRALSEGQAISLAKWAIAAKYGVGPGDFLATDEATEVYKGLLDEIAGYACTSYGKLKVNTLFPSSSENMIEDCRKRTTVSISVAQCVRDIGMLELLSTVKPLRDRPAPKVRDRAVVVRTPEDLKELRSRGIDRLIDIHHAQSTSEIIDIAGGYSHVCIVGGYSKGRSHKPVESTADRGQGGIEGDRYGGEEWENGSSIASVTALDEMEQAKRVEEWYLVPEAVLFFFKDNLDILLPAAKAAKILTERITSGAVAGLPVEISGPIGRAIELSHLLCLLEGGGSKECARIEGVLKAAEQSVNNAAAWANKELKAKIESSSVTLAGGDLLAAIGRGDGVKDLFMVQMRGIFQGVVRAARAQASQPLDLRGSEIAMLEEVFSSEVRYPFEVDRNALRGFVGMMSRKKAELQLKEYRSLAKALAERKEEAYGLVAAIMDFDFLHAIGSFSISRGLSMPEIIREPSMGFTEGRNLSLNDPMPVSYSLGKTGMTEFTEQAVILSGVNSGGKTSLLNLIAQIAILAQMGLTVPAKSARQSIFDQLYYFGKSRGTLSAGAFETAMRKFSVVESDSRKIVLADELEAITEPGASARIIACMLDELGSRESVAVFVSHLAVEVQRFAKTRVRIDGIEAEGLDKDNNLIVVRSPKYNYLARSTPELILDRLVRTTKGREQEFYRRILSRF